MADEIKILLVEDDPDDADLVINELKKLGFEKQTHWVKSGEECLDFLFGTGAYAKQNIMKDLKIILLDLRLPRMDGQEVLRIIKSYEKTRNIPVVILTGSKDEEDILKSYEKGANSYVLKPMKTSDFIRAVEEIGQYWLSINVPRS